MSRVDAKGSAVMAIEHMMLGRVFLCWTTHSQVQSDFSHDNLCSVTLGKTALTSVSWCPHTRTTQLKHLVCLLEGGEGGDNIHA